MGSAKNGGFVPRKTRIIIQEESHTPGDWRPFVAGLCFIEFYTQFVSWGQHLVLFIREEHRPTPLDKTALVLLLRCAIGLLCASAFLGYGRALWQKRPTTGYWLTRVIALSVASIAATFLTMDDLSVPNSWRWFRYLIGATWASAPNNLPWLGLLLAGVWDAYRRRNRHARAASWVTFATIWCAFTVPYWCDWGWLLPRDRETVTGLTVTVLTGLCLMMRRKEARSFAMGTGAVSAVPVIQSVRLWMILTHAACVGVLVSTHEPLPLPSWSSFFLYRDVFKLLCVDLVGVSGPWVLIAIYAWRVPMLVPPDDGSPFPRRYCGKCLYNLHGIDSPRCPECGSELDWAACGTRAGGRGTVFANSTCTGGA